MTTPEYRIICAQHKGQFEELVNGALAEGWITLGGVTRNELDNEFCQSVMRQPKPEGEVRLKDPKRGKL